MGVKNHCTACRSQHKKIGFDKKENMWLLVGSETVESKPVKLETSRKGESPLSYDQCDQIAWFMKVLCNKFYYKSSPNSW